MNFWIIEQNKTLFGILKISDKPITSEKRIGNQAYVFYHNEEIVGLNILEVNKIFNKAKKGMYYLTNNIIEKINSELGLKIHNNFKNHFFIGEILECEKIEGSDKLKKCLVNFGSEKIQIVCGSKDAAANLKVVVATIGAVMPDGTLIEKGSLKKVDSYGMICGEHELLLGEKGILFLDQKNAKVGSEFDTHFNKI